MIIFKPRNGTVFYLKICMMTLSGLRTKLSPCSYILFIVDIVINSIKDLSAAISVVMTKCANVSTSLIKIFHDA